MNASEVTNLFLPPMSCVRNLILLEAAIKRYSTNRSFLLISVRDLKFQVALITAATRNIRDTTGFWHLPIGKTIFLLSSMLFLFTKFILIF